MLNIFHDDATVLFYDYLFKNNISTYFTLQQYHQIMMKSNPLRMLLLAIGTSYTIQAANLTRASQSHHEELIETFSFEFWVFAIISLTLSCFAGVCSGLTVGYMSISKAQMELWSKSDNQDQRRISKPILDILSNHHFLLSTLLLSNALALEALPIFLDKIMPPLMAVIISTIAVVVFGEVIPQAYCTGHHKVSIGYHLAPFIRVLECVLYPFVKPIVYLLDKFIEHDQSNIVLTREKLKTILLLHNKKQYGYRPEQMEILQNILDLRNVLVSHVMIPLKSVFMLPSNEVIDQKLVEKLLQFNFSKIPIYEKQKQKVIGFIKVKNVFEFVLSEKMSLKASKIIANVVEIKDTQNLLDAIDILKTKKINFAVVINEAGRCKGIITLKQIFEKIVLKQFKDDDIQVHIEFNKYGTRMDAVVQAQQQA